MTASSCPPLAIDCNRVLFYAILDPSVKYTMKQRLFVGGRLLGRVSNIAICKSLQRNINGYLILYCDRRWKVKGFTVEKSLGLAKREVEKFYSGIDGKWVQLKSSTRSVKAWMAQNEPSSVCNFCGKISCKVDQFFTRRSTSICSSCVEILAKALKSNK